MCYSVGQQRCLHSYMGSCQQVEQLSQKAYANLFELAVNGQRSGCRRIVCHSSRLYLAEEKQISMEHVTEPSRGQDVSTNRTQPRKLTKNLVVKCPDCKAIILEREYHKNLKVCPHCNHHFRLRAHERIEALVDPESFVEIDADLISLDPLRFVSQSQVYAEKLEEERKKTGINDAVVIGHATIDGKPLALGVMDFHFVGGSMGSVVGEKITRVVELALERRLPLLISAASGGARMQEGLYSLMQMAKTSAALAKLSAAGLPYFSLLTNPTTGGVTASFAMLGDIILSEPGGLVCFAGPRVIEQFMHVTLPKGTASAEFLLEHGLIDLIVPRGELRQVLAQLLRFYQKASSEATLKEEIRLLPPNSTKKVLNRRVVAKSKIRLNTQR